MYKSYIQPLLNISDFKHCPNKKRNRRDIVPKMPTYEMTVIMRKLAQPALVSAVKRVADEIYVGGGYIRNIQSLGTRSLPNTKKSKGLTHKEGTYMLMNIDIKTKEIDRLKDEYNRDKDIIQQFFLSRHNETFECTGTLDDERKSPSERPSIQRLIEEGRRPPRFSKLWDPKTGLNYNPFHR